MGLTESGRDSVSLFEEIGGYVTVGEGGSDAGWRGGVDKGYGVE